ncbi:MAG: hypothetical protein ACREM8_14785, partial [Vulcanimicrobiaceae bacterium]
GRLARYGAGAVPGSASRLEGDRLVLRSGELAATYARSGEARYVTPDGAAVYRTDGTLAVGDLGTLARDRRLWLWLLALSCAALAASKWNGLYLIGGIWTLVVLVAAQRYAIPLLRGLGIPIAAGPALLGNPRGFSADLVIGTTLLVAASGYTLSYIPYFTLGHNLADLVNLQYQMYHYHATLRATHPYSSVWWQWPLLQIPISYYWKDFRIGAATQNPHACCVAEILALPNPVVFWFGLASVPLVAWLAWREWKKGYVLLIAAYLFEWLPWAVSPRELTFEYHFFPNLAVIAICDAIVLERFARWLTAQQRDSGRAAHVCIGLICAVVVAAFVYWYPVLAGVPIRWDDWNARMLTPLMHNLW